MARPGTSHSASQGELGVLVTVIRGNTQEVSQVFKWGEESGRLSVGSRGDWSVDGPGVVPVRLWLRFDGQRLYAASGEGPAHLQGRQLSRDWCPVAIGAELRFGFALLRVAYDIPRTVGSASNRTRLIGAVAAGLLLTAVVAVALIFRGGSQEPAKAELPVIAAASDARVAGAGTASVARGDEAPSPQAALAEQPTEPRLVAAPRAPGLAAAAPVAASADALTGGIKPPAAYPQNIANRPVPRIGEKPWLISEEWRAHHERQLHAVNRATAKVIFLGDSITEAWGVAPAYKEYFGKYSPLNLGIASDTTQNVLWRIEHGALDGTHPRAVVLMAGINNLAGGFTPPQTSDGVRALVAAVQAHLPATRVLLLGVLPARQDAANPLRQSIKDANQLLQGLAKPGRVELHDVGSVLLEPDGNISKSIMRDFLHPTAEGFERLSQAVAPLLDSLMSRAGD